MNINELIKKYFDGETSLEEEAQLQAYFTGDEVDESLQQYAPLFQFLKTERQQTLNSDFDRRLLANLQAEGKTAKIRTLRNRRFAITPNRQFIRPLLRIAAAIVVLFGAFLLVKPRFAPEKQQAIDWSKYEIKDPELAYEQTKEALKLLSSKLKKGSEKAVEEVSKTEKVGKYFK